MGAGGPDLENFLPFPIWILMVSKDFSSLFLGNEAQCAEVLLAEITHSYIQKNLAESLLRAKHQADTGIPQ